LPQTRRSKEPEIPGLLPVDGRDAGENPDEITDIVTEETQELAPVGEHRHVPPENNGGRNETLPPLLEAVEQRAGPNPFFEDYNPLSELFKGGDKPYELDFRSDLNEVQILQFARARVMADHFKIPALAKWVEHLERLSVSKQRKGRKEFVDAFKSAIGGNPTQPVNVGDQMAEKLRG